MPTLCAEIKPKEVRKGIMHIFSVIFYVRVKDIMYGSKTLGPRRNS